MGWNELAARKLSLESCFHGHEGCVNRLAWNEAGTFLASGSDDTDIRLWAFPEDGSRQYRLPTLHEANIFGVQFLPHSGSSKMVTGAMDKTVQLHTLDVTAPDAYKRAPPGTSTSRTGEERDNSIPAQTAVFHCHRGRVKQVEVHPDEPNLFWSASEDGTVRQFDIRQPLEAMRRPESQNILFHLSSAARQEREVKSIALNPARPYEMAVATGGEGIFITDRRLPSFNATAHAANVVLTLKPPHAVLAREAGRQARAVHPTFVKYNSRGTKLLATYHGDNAYCWSIAPGEPVESCMEGSGAVHFQPQAARKMGNGSESTGSGSFSKMEGQPDFFRPAGVRRPGAVDGIWALPRSAEQRRVDGNLAIFQKRYSEAIRHYTEGLRTAPDAPALLTGRALALLMRGWHGDHQQALHDAERAVLVDPDAQLGHLRRAQALRECGLLKSASMALEVHRRRFPDHGADVEKLAESLERDIEEAKAAESARRRRENIRREARRRQGMQYDLRRRRTGEIGPNEEPPVRGAGESGGSAGEGPSQAAEAPPPAPALAGDGAGPSDGAVVDAAEPLALEWRQQDAALQVRMPIPGLVEGVASDDEVSGADKEEEGQESDGDDGDGFAGSNLDRAYAASLRRLEAALKEARNGTYAGIENGNSRGNKWSSAPARQPWLWGTLPSSDRYLQRYVGHCNIDTDIKEATFLGDDDSLVACGSDDGRVFFYDASTGACLRALSADEDVVNCLRSHPTLPVLATSGIESVVKVWSPEGAIDPGEEVESVAQTNQEQMKSGVNLRVMRAIAQHAGLFRMVRGPTPRDREAGGEDDDDEDGEEGLQPVECRMA